MQKVVNLRLHAQQIVKNQTKKRRSAVNTRLCQSFNLLLSIGIMLFSLQSARAQEAKRISISIKEASIKSALTEVQKLSGVKFSYGQDISKYADIKVTYDGKDKSVDEVVAQILKPTNLHAVKMDGYLVIEEKPAPQTTRSPNGQAGQEQQGTGSLKGRIVEFETSNPLPGATVRILGTQIAAQSDENGYYTLSGIPAGNRTLEASFIGYGTETVSTNVRSGQASTYDVKLQGSNTLEEVVISGIGKTRAPVAHTSDRQLIAEIKQMKVIASGISSEQISKSADRNAADAVAKVSGVSIRDNKFVVVRGMNERYNLTYLNNDLAPSTEIYSRAFALDLLPTRIIDRILVFKSPSADLLGDMTGGAVKIYTKDAVTVRHFDIDVQLGVRESTTFNKNFLSYQGGKLDFLGFDDGTRKLPSTVPGYGDLTKAHVSQATYANSFSNKFEYGKVMALPDIQVTANYYDVFKLGSKNLSMLSSLSYKKESNRWETERVQGLQYASQGFLYLNRISHDNVNNANAQLSLLQNFTFKLSDNHRLRFKNFLLQQGQDQTIVKESRGPFVPGNDGEWKYETSIKSEQKNIVLSYAQRFLYSGNLSGEHRFGANKHSVNWSGGYVFTRQAVPDQRVMRFDNSSPSGGTNDDELFSEYRWTALKREQFAEGGSLNNVELGKISRSWTQNTEQVGNFALDYETSIRPWASLKAGTYHQFKQRNLFRRVYTLNEGDLNDSGYPDNWVIGSNGNFMDYNLVYYREQDLGNVWSEKYLRDDGSALKVYDRTSGSDSYKAYERLNTGYALVNIKPLGEMADINAGIRIEHDIQRIASAENLSQAGKPNIPIYVDNNTTDWLPSVNISLRPTQQWVFRLAYGKTLNRTEFREAASFSEMDYVNNQSIIGNPNLKASKATNYDARLEWYSQSEKGNDMLSVGAFYKDITNPIERTVSRDFAVNIPNPTISWLNAKQATIQGLEIELRKQLDFIPGRFFRDLSVVANYTRLHSVVDSIPNGRNYDSSTDQVTLIYQKRTLQGQAPYILNAGLYYDNAGSGTKISVIMNAIGERIYAASTGRKGEEIGGQYSERGYLGSLLELPRKQWDIAVTQRIGKGLQMKLAVQNVLDDEIRIAEDSNFTFKYEPLKYQAGQEPYPYSGDPIDNHYKPGRYFSLGINYSF
mgnify:CR=1 FL=1